MKMRKRIAALLAVAMVAALMPMTAFATSDNRLTHDVIQVAKGGSNSNQGQKLKIDLKDGIDKDDVFFVELEGAKWDSSLTTVGAIKIGNNEAIDASEFSAHLNAAGNILEFKRLGNDLSSGELTIPVIANDIDGNDDGDAYVKVDGWNTAISSSKHLFARTSTARATVTIADAPTFYNGTNKIAKIKIEENSVGAFRKAAKEGKDTFVVDLYNSDYEFVGLDDVEFDFSMGFRNANANDIERVIPKKEDTQRAEFKVKETIPAAQRGVIEFELKVKSIGRKPETGELEATISGDLVEETTAVVANIVDYDVVIETAKDYEFYAGRQEKVEFTLSETVFNSIATNRYTEFSLPEGVYFNEAPTYVDKHDKNETEVVVDPIYNTDDQMTGFSVEFDTTRARAKNEAASFAFKAKLDIPSAFEGDVVLATEGRAFEDIEAVIAKVNPAIKVTIEPMTVKEGLKKQVGGKIVIEEMVKGALNRGEEILLGLEGDKGIEFTEATYKVTDGDIRLVDGATTKGAIYAIGIKRESRKPSTIEITDVTLRLDRTVPEGAYDLNVGGPAISKLVDKKVNGKTVYGYDNIVTKDFLYVGARYTRPVTVFTIGSNIYTVNGETKVMDAEAYLKDGRTMVPVRFLAEALGINKKSIKFYKDQETDKGIITIFHEGTVVQMVDGDNKLMVNGITFPIEGSVEIKEGRTYAPVKDIGQVFGVTGDWDAAARTATFK